MKKLLLLLAFLPSIALATSTVPWLTNNNTGIFPNKINGVEVKVGIGTSTPQRTLVVNGSALIGTSSNDSLVVGGPSTSSLVFLGVYTVKPKIFVNDDSLLGEAIGSFRAGDDTTPSSYFAVKSRGTIDSPLVVEPGDFLYNIYGIGYNGGTYMAATRIKQMMDPNETIDDATDQIPGRIVLETTWPHDGNLGLPVERFAIDSHGRAISSDDLTGHTGNLLSIFSIVGTTSDDTGYGLAVQDTANADKFTVRNDGFTSIFGNGYISGKLGVGTTTPDAYIDVYADSIDNVGLDFTNANTDGNARLRLKADTSGGGRPFLQLLDTTSSGDTATSGASFTLERTSNRILNGARNDLIIQVFSPTASTSILFGTDGSEKMRISTVGNVGIGTTSPWGLLSVQGFSANTTPIFEVATSTGKPVFDIMGNGHTKYTGPKPVVSSCGTNPTNQGNDARGRIYGGTANPTSCTLTFASAYNVAPICQATYEVDAPGVDITASSTPTTLVITSVGGVFTGKAFTYACDGI